ncbi:MAG TPA: 50S ribosomal protein L6 [Chloroflexota bacterium]|nr:50S ribosomal protein L6 [Chloroflexota bacterium]
MSRIGRKPIAIPGGVELTQENGAVRVRGPRGELSQSVPASIRIRVEDGLAEVVRENDEAEVRALHGLTRSLLANMVTGVTTGFTKVLEISGVGYRAQKTGNNLTLSVGYSHPVEIIPPPGIEFTVESPTRVVVGGIDKQSVGEVAARIRRTRKPEPYKGKGIRYSDEVIRRKPGKAGRAGA